MRRRRFRPSYSFPAEGIVGFAVIALAVYGLVSWGVTLERMTQLAVVGGGLLVVLLFVAAWFTTRDYFRKLAVQTTLEDVDAMSGPEFETYIVALLKEVGYTQVTATPQQGDFGVDALFHHQGQKYAAQLKRYKKPVGIEALYQATGGQRYYQADHAAVITNAYLTPAAQEFANKTGIYVVDRDKLGEWIRFVQEQSVKERRQVDRH